MESACGLDGEALPGRADSGWPHVTRTCRLMPPPRLGVGQALAEGALVEILPQLVAEPMPVTLLYAQRRHLPARVRTFMDWIAELLQPHLLA